MLYFFQTSLLKKKRDIFLTRNKIQKRVCILVSFTRSLYLKCFLFYHEHEIKEKFGVPMKV